MPCSRYIYSFALRMAKTHGVLAFLCAKGLRSHLKSLGWSQDASLGPWLPPELRADWSVSMHAQDKSYLRLAKMANSIKHLFSTGKYWQDICQMSVLHLRASCPPTECQMNIKLDTYGQNYPRNTPLLFKEIAYSCTDMIKPRWMWLHTAKAQISLPIYCLVMCLW